MNTLSESFGAEIKQFPDNYFLTFEMYDLLHDWNRIIFCLFLSQTLMTESHRKAKKPIDQTN